MNLIQLLKMLMKMTMNPIQILIKNIPLKMKLINQKQQLKNFKQTCFDVTMDYVTFSRS